MAFHGNQYGRLGELVSNDALDDIDAEDATRQRSDRRNRTSGSVGGTVIRALLIGFVVIIAIGLAMILLS